MNLGFKTHSRHSQGFAYPFLVIDDEFLGQDVENFLIGGNGHGARGVYNPVNIHGQNFSVPDRDDTVGIHATNVAPGDARIDRSDMAPRHQLGLFHGTLNGRNRGLDIDYDAFFHAGGTMHASADDFDLPPRADRTDNRDYLRGANIQADDHFRFVTANHIQNLTLVTHRR